jgi:diguanylate cyclase (GGDEF)-like protein/PAS domain S-box-containing protein
MGGILRSTDREITFVTRQQDFDGESDRRFCRSANCGVRFPIALFPLQTHGVTRMTDTNVSAPTSNMAAASNTADTTDQSVLSVEQGQTRVGQLLAILCESAPAAEDSPQPNSRPQFENQLALVRLGMATSLFLALRTKHGPTAGHCLRVALSCSAWSDRMQLDEQTRDRIEVAALLHDLGKIGIPDRILRKPGKLSVEEQLMMDSCPESACEILRGCTSDRDLLDIVSYSNTWFDSRRHGEGPRGDALPIGARMLAIANAFDAMTTDSVYRGAMSRERAIGELNEGSGTQFDPELVADFSRMLEQRPEMLQGVIVDRWLQQLHPSCVDSLWDAHGGVGAIHLPETVRRESLFFQQLIENMDDGVVFTDTEGTITQWNDVMHQLTSIAGDAIVGQSWSNECIRLRERDATREEGACLVAECLRSNARVARPMLIEQPGEEPTPVHAQVSPVLGDTPGTYGTVVIIRDLSDQANLEEQLESLYYQTTHDPLTRIANRSHFDETLRELSANVNGSISTFSLIICDIDHFKRVNDIHGHPAGDEALISFASILSSHSREGDLVARYGGEEFLLLAVNCDNATATHRAEAIRSALERTVLPSLAGETVTASFGVTEFQSGDTPESVLARADRALLKAKDNGRNRVIQFGAGQSPDSPAPQAKKGWLGWFESESLTTRSEFDIQTAVPVDLVIEKLRGFIADHHAEIISVSENQVALKLNATDLVGGRRRVDQHVALRAQLTLSESKNPISGTGTGTGFVSTNVHVNLQPIRNRDRRGRELSASIDQVVASLKSYLMGEIVKS